MIETIETIETIEAIERPVAPPTTSSPKPLLRGWIHAAAAIVTLLFIAALVMGSVLPDRRLTLVIFGGSLVELYTVSATFHLMRWRGKLHTYLRLLDHASIFVLIAASSTAFAAEIPPIGVRLGFIALLWVAAAGGITAKALHPGMSRGLSAALYVRWVGWVDAPGCFWDSCLDLRGWRQMPSLLHCSPWC